MSQDLLWQLLRTNNSFVVKRDGITLSGEPGNLTNVHSHKHSGLANNRVLHVSADASGKVSAHKKLSRALRKPAFANHTVALTHHRRNKQTTAAKRIVELTANRPDLTRHAVARYHALHKAAGAKAGTGPNIKRRRTKAAKAQ